MALFSRKKSSADNGESSAGSGAPIEAFKRDERKAQTWFRHARTAGDGRSYDYAIHCFTHGLQFDPDRMSVHEELREAGLKRKVNGGKPPGIKDKKAQFGKDPVGRLCDAARLSALDPLNVGYLVTFIERATDAGEAIEELNMAELVYWLAGMTLPLNRENAKKPDKRVCMKIMECCERLQIWQRAIEACRDAAHIDPNDSTLVQKLKDLEAENVMREGGYDQTDGDFKKSVKGGIEEQLSRGDDDAIIKTVDALDAMIKRRRVEYEERPEDIDVMLKFVTALRQKETIESENEAISVLKEALESTGQYRFKAEIGNIRMRQMARQLRRLRADYEAHPNDADAKKAFIDGTRQLLAFELQEYEERVKNYPTDMTLRFHYGRRLFQSQRYDEAIGALQQAKVDPKVRSAATSVLGQAYMKQGWFDEAIETLEQGVQAHGIADDSMGMDMRYHLMDAYERKARQDNNSECAQKAARIASQLLQTDINYKDIKDRINRIRALNDELKKVQS